MHQKSKKYLVPEGASMAGKNTLFVSYRHKDAEYLAPVIDLLLKRTEYAIWYDENLSAGERFDDEIKSILAKAVLMVQIVTPSYYENKSYTTLKEIPFAKETDTKIAAICVVDDPGLWHLIQDSAPDFSCFWGDSASVEAFVQALNDFNNPVRTDELICFLSKKINCSYIMPSEMFRLAQAFADGYPVRIHKQEAIRYARMAEVCDICGAQELLCRLEAMG